MHYLALLLLAPTSAVLAWLYWRVAGGVRSARGRLFDALVLLLAVAIGAGWAMHGFMSIPAHPHMSALGRVTGGIWKQVLPVLYGYGAYCATLTCGLLTRWMLFRRRPPR